MALPVKKRKLGFKMILFGVDFLLLVMRRNMTRVEEIEINIAYRNQQQVNVYLLDV
jgi:hypothetical protein